MFGHWRQHKRSGSTPSSPLPPQQFNAASPSLASAQDTDFFSQQPPHRPVDHPSAHSDSPVSPFPPVLPPIPRVASRYESAAEARERRNSSNGEAEQRQLKSKPAAEIVPQQQFVPLPPNQEAKETIGQRPSTAGPTGYRARGQAALPAHQDDRSWSSHSPMNVSTTPQSAQHYTQQTSPMPMNYDLSPVTTRQTPPSATSQNNAPKSGKPRLNLRNPMSLLMRRRSGQHIEQLSEDSLMTHKGPFVPAMKLPDNYDPSIRGKKVHDFSAPRPNRTVSYDASQHQNSQFSHDQSRQATDDSPPRTDRAHTPVFTEHFNDDGEMQDSEAAVRAETLANKDFLKRVSIPPPERITPPLPVFARRSLQVPPETLDFSGSSLGPGMGPLEHESISLDTVPEASPTVEATPDVTPKKNISKRTPPKTRSRATSGASASFQPAGLPSHMTSKASRFSFQMQGGESLEQEKLLEERHKQKAAKRVSDAASADANDGGDEYEEEDIDYEAMLEEDDFEEPIPGGEIEFSSATISSQQLPTLGGFDFGKLQGSPMSPVSPDGRVLSPTYDTQGRPIGFGFTDSNMQAADFPGNLNAPFAGLGLHLPQAQGGAAQTSEPTPELTPADQVGGENLGQKMSVSDADDMYFDDGLIDVPEDAIEPAFDESVFDDPTSHLYERKPVMPAPQDEARRISSELDEDDLEQMANTGAAARHSRSLIAPRPSITATSNKPARTMDDPQTSFDNLAAYHSALAQAANRAAADGRFVRKPSVSSNMPASEDDSGYRPQSIDSQPSLIPDDGRVSQETSFMSPPASALETARIVDDDFDYDDYDSALEDDPIIAAANAEALAYDSEGEYGSEFGFYASAQGEAEFVNGGYFGNRDALGRSTSGRNVLREPNLTPITERSEYSTRNSYISVNNYFGPGSSIPNSSGPLPSPGLAQLARFSPYGVPDAESDPEMSLEMLKKLRRGAFGGSNPSLGSAGSSPNNSSPIAPYAFFPPTVNGASPLAAQSRLQINSDDDNSPSLGDEQNVSSGNELNTLSEEDEEEILAANADDEDVDEFNYVEDDTDAEDYSQPPSPTIRAASNRQNFFVNSAATTSHGTDGILSPVSPLAQDPTSPTAHSYNNTFAQSMPSPLTDSTHPNSPLTPAVPFPSTEMRTRLDARPEGYVPGHKRGNSGQEKVTYVREEDEDGSSRWVLERRRTSLTTGELELVGREVVEGGRI